MNRIWIKLYIEILDDYKFSVLDDHLKWRAIELFLVAGENGDEGLLPPNDRLAWRIRLGVEEVEKTLLALKSLGIVNQTEQGWMVSNFKRRQYSESYERVKRYRQRESNGDCNDSVTENETDKESSSLSSSSSFSLSLEERVQGEKPKAPAEAMFTDVLGRFFGEKERKRWLILYEAIGAEKAQALIDWANKKEIQLVNRPALLDSLETAAKKWRDPSKDNGKNSSAAFIKALAEG
jgi:hypothetical protein